MPVPSFMHPITAIYAHIVAQLLTPSSVTEYVELRLCSCPRVSRAQSLSTVASARPRAGDNRRLLDNRHNASPFNWKEASVTGLTNCRRVQYGTGLAFTESVLYGCINQRHQPSSALPSAVHERTLYHIESLNWRINSGVVSRLLAGRSPWQQQPSPRNAPFLKIGEGARSRPNIPTYSHSHMKLLVFHLALLRLHAILFHVFCRMQDACNYRPDTRSEARSHCVIALKIHQSTQRAHH